MVFVLFLKKKERFVLDLGMYGREGKAFIVRVEIKGWILKYEIVGISFNEI